MAYIDLKNKVIQVKIVYYGPGRGGKTTNLEFIHQQFEDRIKTKMVSIKTDGDRTLFFDFLPFDMGSIRGYNLKIQLYTVPGQIKYNATRKLVLQGVDGIVFVADSARECDLKNRRSLLNLQENLAHYKKSIFSVPLIMQYNKRDLGEQGVDLLTVDQMEKILNRRLKAPSYPASALTGENVVSTLKAIVTHTVAELEKQLQ